MQSLQKMPEEMLLQRMKWRVKTESCLRGQNVTMLAEGSQTEDISRSFFVMSVEMH